MKYSIIFLIFFSSVMLAQEQEEAQEQEGQVLDQSAEEIAGLKIDLLAQRRATIQAKANWLDREQRLLQTEDANWQRDRANLILELKEKFQCEGTYDLDNRRCIGE